MRCVKSVRNDMLCSGRACPPCNSPKNFEGPHGGQSRLLHGRVAIHSGGTD